MYILDILAQKQIEFLLLHFLCTQLIETITKDPIKISVSILFNICCRRHTESLVVCAYRHQKLEKI